MSYDISFKVRVADTDKFVTVGNCDANITWNVRKIIELSTGLPWLNEENNGYCVDIMPTIMGMGGYSRRIVFSLGCRDSP